MQVRRAAGAEPDEAADLVLATMSPLERPAPAGPVRVVRRAVRQRPARHPAPVLHRTVQAGAARRWCGRQREVMVADWLRGLRTAERGKSESGKNPAPPLKISPLARAAARPPSGGRLRGGAGSPEHDRRETPAIKQRGRGRIRYAGHVSVAAPVQSRPRCIMAGALLPSGSGWPPDAAKYAVPPAFKRRVGRASGAIRCLMAGASRPAKDTDP